MIENAYWKDCPTCKGTGNRSKKKSKIDDYDDLCQRCGGTGMIEKIDPMFHGASILNQKPDDGIVPVEGSAGATPPPAQERKFTIDDFKIDDIFTHKGGS